MKSGMLLKGWFSLEEKEEEKVFVIAFSICEIERL
jgi:hypothetical protein